MKTRDAFFYSATLPTITILVSDGLFEDFQKVLSVDFLIWLVFLYAGSLLFTIMLGGPTYLFLAYTNRVSIQSYVLVALTVSILFGCIGLLGNSLFFTIEAFAGLIVMGTSTSAFFWLIFRPDKRK